MNAVAAWSLSRIATGDEAAIHRIARGMRDTLIEVEGAARGASLYTDDWLRDRVRWHLDAARGRAAIWLAHDASGGYAGHTIVREERAEEGASFGLVSTTWVEPSCRRAGLARAFLAQGEAWFRSAGLAESRTWTSATNRPLIALYGQAGYREIERGPNEETGTMMVCLARRLAGS